MFTFRIKRMMRLRGIEKHYNFMVKLGFVPSTARSFLDGSISSVKLEQLDKLCVALNCTPNDLLEWQPRIDQPVSETHSLNALRKKAGGDLSELLKEISTDKFEQIIDLLQDLKDK